MAVIAPKLDFKDADFFMSRAGADADFAEQIGAILEGWGYCVILQQWDFGNRNFMHCMHEALDSGAHVIALLSADYLNSKHCIAEALNIISDDPVNENERLLVWRVTECKPTGMFKGLVFHDVFQGREHADKLPGLVRKAVGKIEPRRKRHSPAPTPAIKPAQTVLHDRIREVPNFTGRREDLAALDAFASSRSIYCSIASRTSPCAGCLRAAARRRRRSTTDASSSRFSVGDIIMGKPSGLFRR